MAFCTASLSAHRAAAQPVELLHGSSWVWGGLWAVFLLVASRDVCQGSLSPWLVLVPCLSDSEGRSGVSAGAVRAAVIFNLNIHRHGRCNLSEL